MDIQSFSVRSLTRTDELLGVLHLQNLVYMDEDAYKTQLYTLIEIMRNGGVVLGAFDGDMLIGFLVAFLGTEIKDPSRPAMANLKMILSRLGVHPDYRNVTVATRLMRRLREIATKQGIRLITYGINPLDSRSVYLSIGKLGAIAKTFVPDFYGTEDIDGNDIGSTDQLIAEWWLTQNRVDERLHGSRPTLKLEQYLEAETPLLNPTVLKDDQVYPYDVPIEVIKGRQLLLLEIPRSYQILLRGDRSVLLTWKQHVRDGLQTLMQAGYVVTDALRESFEGRPRAFYVMSFDGPRMTFRF